MLSAMDGFGAAHNCTRRGSLRQRSRQMLRQERCSKYLLLLLMVASKMVFPRVIMVSRGHVPQYCDAEVQDGPATGFVQSMGLGRNVAAAGLCTTLASCDPDCVVSVRRFSTSRRSSVSTSRRVLTRTVSASKTATKLSSWAEAKATVCACFRVPPGQGKRSAK